MSTPVVMIGFILLVPSVLAMVGCALILVASALSGAALSAHAKDEAIARMRKADFPPPLARAIADGRDDDVNQWIASNRRTLSRAEVGWIRDAQRNMRSAQTVQAFSIASSVVGTGFAIMLGICFFVSGLLGWLLVMKKDVLQCSLCRAVVNAS